MTEPAISDSVAPTEAATETATETATEAESSASGSASDSSLPSWVWILVAAGALAAVLALILGRSRRRSSWNDDVTTARAEATWFARELLPQLQRSASSDEVAGGWKVATHRVTTLEDRLTGLQASAPDEASGARARRLRDAVRDARHAVDDLVQVGDLTTQVRELSLTSARLDAALAPPASG